MKTNPNDPISPVHEATRVMENGMDDMGSCILAGGLTKREYFAAMAMQGLLANSFDDGVSQPASTLSGEQLAVIAVDQADRLIEALNKD